ncbi:f55bd541-8c70-4aa4-aaa4-d66c0f219975 [Sclerotinia trifoliorum]|uniref:F55bd541-8c70-4aa4-aaa4-d66c0f219975 n=1 Tax=Sclerotinia trifoliorum TaxID=28548 RepID=A0A8H2VNX4_9HELO|nr:f55bd541-8c70-4aa4-aaa4-d66c0f219975 [Sclerotinia trifoliorum]
MADTEKKAGDDLATLKTTVGTIKNLIQQLQASAKAPEDVKEGSSSEETEQPKHADVNAIDLAHDSASLIKAHSTKLSLLIINKPFTASAINKVLRELVAGPLPGLASAVEICNAAKYTKAMSEELQWRVKKVLTELSTLIDAIPLDGKVLSEDKKNGTGKSSGKGSLASTGVVWDACDSVMGLKTLGVAGLAMKKAEEYRDLVKDALEELQAWAEEESDDDEDDEDENSGDEDDEKKDPQDIVDDLFGSQSHIPKGDPEKIREKLESSTKRLRLIILMYQAVEKRRLKTLPRLPHPELPAQLKEKSPEDPGIVECLDEVLVRMKKITNLTDDLASAFYDLDSAAIDKLMDETWFTGFATVELLIKNWEGQKDDFTTWAYKFQLAMKKGW